MPVWCRQGAAVVASPMIHQALQVRSSFGLAMGLMEGFYNTSACLGSSVRRHLPLGRQTSAVRLALGCRAMQYSGARGTYENGFWRWIVERRNNRRRHE